MVAVSLRCRSWTCPTCKEDRKRELVRRAIEGAPQRFVTITVNPSIGTSPTHRAQLLANAWRLVTKRAARRRDIGRLEYLAVFEKTKRGEPHLHILVRSRYIPQIWLSQVMREIINSPIVDIRRIDDPKKAARYISKYIAKEPFKFGTCKRFWSTQTWRIKNPDEQPFEPASAGSWTVIDKPLWKVCDDWKRQGFEPQQPSVDCVFWGTPPPWFKQRARSDAAAVL